MIIHRILALFGSCGGLVHASPKADADSRPTVTLASGVVVGTTTTLQSATAAVNKFVGIPFAASPPERFSPPKPHPSWTKPLNAVTTKPACIQQFNYPESAKKKTMALFNNPGGPPPQESEDCLYLNIYTPPNTKPSSAKAVMFWIYGGDLQFGDGSLLYYDGSSFAYNQDVIVVTHNYRTNVDVSPVFGYPNSPQLPSNQQNAGFLDQRAALTWVHQNIAKFGGSASKITIFGESAGGESVKQLLALPPSPLPFRAAIMESEAALFVGNSTINWEVLVQSMGCSTASSPIACMRTKPAKAIKSKIEHMMLDFAPVDNGITSTSDVRPPISAGTAAKVPFIIGTNADEGRVFTYIEGLDRPGGNITEFLINTFPGDEPLQCALQQLYDSSGQTPYIFASEVITNSTFLCPTSMLASYAQSHGYDVWRYLYNASFPNVRPFPDSGAFHSSEIPEVFGTYPLKGATKRQKALSRYMQKAWAQFAKSAQSGPGWPSLGSKGRVEDLGGGGIGGEKTILASSLDGPCALYAPLIDAEGL